MSEEKNLSNSELNAADEFANAPQEVSRKCCNFSSVVKTVTCFLSIIRASAQ